MPETRLIDATRLHAQVFNENGGDLSKTENVAQILLRIENAPTIDAQPVKHGHWHSIMMSEATGWDLSLTGGRDNVCEWICSLCKRPAIVDENGEDFLPSFCPNCGVKMDGGDTDA